MAEEKEKQVELPVLDKAAIEKSEEVMAAYKEIFTPPEGKKLAGKRSICSIHGDVTRASMPLSYVRYFKNEEGKKVPVMYRDVVCMGCLTEALGDLWREHTGKEFGVITESPIFADLTEEDKKAMAEAKEKASETETPSEA